jgi:hypothetical protein
MMYCLFYDVMSLLILERRVFNTTSFILCYRTIKRDKDAIYIWLGFFLLFLFFVFCGFMFVFKGKRLNIDKFSYTSTTRAVYLRNNRYSFCYSVSLRFMTKNENGASNILKILLYVLTEFFTKVTC